MTPDFGPRFGPAQRRLYDTLRDAGDVHVKDVYRAVIGKRPLDTDRITQQFLGPYVTKTNRRIRPHGLAVKPGERKYTYRLVVL